MPPPSVLMTSAEVANPLIPAAYDLAWSGVVVLALALAITALVSIVRASGGGRDLRMLWGIAVVLLPILGSICWFLSDTRRASRARSGA